MKYFFSRKCITEYFTIFIDDINDYYMISFYIIIEQSTQEF